MIAFLNAEAGGSKVRELLASNPAECYAHAVNFAEVYYVFLRRGGVSRAESALRDLLNVGILLRDDMDVEFWKEAAALKALHAIALPDCFCISLARRIFGTVVSTDHGEMDQFLALDLVPILFIR